jgi:NADH-ubiquinone oxidoreductase chain 2
MPKISLLIFLLELYLNIGIIEYNYSSISGISSITELDKTSIIYYLKNLILISSILSLIIGSTVGLSQNRIKRLLAYSTISHLGFMLLALSINTEQSVESLIFYIVQYSLTNLNIFLIILAVGILIHSSTSKDYYLDSSFEDKGSENDIEYIKQLKGLFFYNPLLSLSLSICLFSMAGIPPLIGFFSKQFVLYAAIQKGFYFISIVAVIVSVISASYYLNVIKILHISDSTLTTKANKTGKELNINSTHSFIISSLTISILLFILKPSIILNSTAILSLTLFYF